MSLINKILNEVGKHYLKEVDINLNQHTIEQEDFDNYYNSLCLEFPKGSKIDVYTKFLNQPLKGIITTERLSKSDSTKLCSMICKVKILENIVNVGGKFGLYLAYCLWNKNENKWIMTDDKLYGDNWLKVFGIRKN